MHQSNCMNISANTVPNVLKWKENKNVKQMCRTTVVQSTVNTLRKHQLTQRRLNKWEKGNGQLQ